MQQNINYCTDLWQKMNYLLSSDVRCGRGLHWKRLVRHLKWPNFDVFLSFIVDLFSGAGNQAENFSELLAFWANDKQMWDRRSFRVSICKVSKAFSYVVYRMPSILLQARFWIFSIWTSCFWVNPEFHKGAAYSVTGRI